HRRRRWPTARRHAAPSWLARRQSQHGGACARGRNHRGYKGGSAGGASPTCWRLDWSCGNAAYGDYSSLPTGSLSASRGVTTWNRWMNISRAFFGVPETGLGNSKRETTATSMSFWSNSFFSFCGDRDSTTSLGLNLRSFSSLSLKFGAPANETTASMPSFLFTVRT